MPVLLLVWTFLGGGWPACLLRHRSRALESLRDAHHDLLQDVPGIAQRAVDEYQQVERAWFTDSPFFGVCTVTLLELKLLPACLRKTQDEAGPF